MIKLLHSADWHLDSPIQGRNARQTQLLKAALLSVPEKVAQVCKRYQCDMVVLSGDLFDGPYTQESYQAVRTALAQMEVPVYIAPGNHDSYGPGSVWAVETWPENVHIFTQNYMSDSPDGCVVGGAFTGAYSDGMLRNYLAGNGRIGVLHGDPTQVTSPYCAVTTAQVQQSGLAYLALGHIHKGGSFRCGNTLCAWPGCPMGRGYDELEDKGVLVVTVEDGQASQEFVSLDLPKFFDFEVVATDDCREALKDLLPPVANQDFYRITFTGNSPGVDLDSLYAAFSDFPNLELRDKTIPPVDLWGSAGKDSFEGMYFARLKQALEEAPESQKETVRLAAEISRRLLDGQEVVLP